VTVVRWLPLLVLAAMLAAQDSSDRWARMLRRDADGDGKISREEFPGPERFFDRLDGDGDGYVTEQEAKAMPGRGGRGGGPTRLLRQLDADGDGKITQEEWGKHFDRADENGDGILDREEAIAALSGRRVRDTAPKVGDAVPQVKARHPRDGREVDLGRPARPTVLVFGSWT